MHAIPDVVSRRPPHGLLRSGLAIVPIAALVFGCGGGATVSPSSPTSAAPARTSGGPPSGVVEVAGTSTCPQMDLDFVTSSDGVQRAHDFAASCIDTVSDPRVVGTSTARWNMDVWGDLSDGGGPQWGTSHMENTGGSWDGRATGAYSSGFGDIFVLWWKGGGGYAGLSYFELLTGHDPWKVRGLIYTGDPPETAGLRLGPIPRPLAAPTGSMLPSASAARSLPVTAVAGSQQLLDGEPGPSTVGQGGVVQYRNGWVVGTETSSDPRVSGTFSASPSAMDFWGGSGTQRGDFLGFGIRWVPVRIENAGGAWEGIGTGIADSHGDTMLFWYTGTGGYAGLSYLELSATVDPFTGADLGSSGSSATYGLIFPGAPPGI